jgi:murein DD-endopeptidase / murein LD-carboxypeptidase
MYFRILLTFIFSIIIFTGCSQKYEDQNIDYRNNNTQNTLQKRYLNMLKNNNYVLNKRYIDFNTAQQKDLNNALIEFYKNWSGVKYEYGGNSRNGIDCSSFIQIAYEDNFDIALPRTTDSQASIGIEIEKSQLEMGDLVFFKTSSSSNHVGIYLEDGKFMHASTSVGVTISYLDNVYFNKYYWKAQRIIY